MYTLIVLLQILSHFFLTPVYLAVHCVRNLSVCLSFTIYICLSFKGIVFPSQRYVQLKATGLGPYFFIIVFSIWIHYSFFMCLMNYKEINCSNNCYRNLIKDIYISNLIYCHFYYLDPFQNNRDRTNHICTSLCVHLNCSGYFNQILFTIQIGREQYKEIICLSP